MSWRTRAPLSAGKLLTRFRKPVVGHSPHQPTFQTVQCVMTRSRANLAVVGCHRAMRWTLADECDLGRTSADDPQTVLKTAGLPSTDVP
jgi:hypothetical protein